MTAVYVLNAAYLALVASTFTRTLAWLRIMLVLGACCFIAYGALEDITSMIAWNTAIGGLHLVRLVDTHRRTRSVRLDPNECSIRDRFFPELSDVDFDFLWNSGTTALHEDELLIRSGTIPNNVSLILDGAVCVHSQGEPKFHLRHGGLLGAISFVSSDVSSFDVYALGTVTVRQWSQDWLRSLNDRNMACARSFQNMIGRDLARNAQLVPLLVPSIARQPV